MLFIVLLGGDAFHTRLLATLYMLLSTAHGSHGLVVPTVHTLHHTLILQKSHMLATIWNHFQTLGASALALDEHWTKGGKALLKHILASSA